MNNFKGSISIGRLWFISILEVFLMSRGLCQDQIVGQPPSTTLLCISECGTCPVICSPPPPPSLPLPLPPSISSPSPASPSVHHSPPPLPSPPTPPPPQSHSTNYPPPPPRFYYIYPTPPQTSSVPVPPSESSSTPPPPPLLYPYRGPPLPPYKPSYVPGFPFPPAMASSFNYNSPYYYYASKAAFTHLSYHCFSKIILLSLLFHIILFCY